MMNTKQPSLSQQLEYYQLYWVSLSMCRAIIHLNRAGSTEFHLVSLGVQLIILTCLHMSTAITVLVVILVYRSRSQSGSWSPNNEIPEEPQIEDNNVTMASFRSLHGPE